MPMKRQLALTTFLARDYDDAIAWFTDALGFKVRQDKDMGGGKRWVEVAPSDGGSGLLIAKAANAQQDAAVGNQAGGRVLFFLHTDDFARDYHAMLAKGVHFVEEPRDEDYGRVVVFTDLYGNKWDLIEPA